MSSPSPTSEKPSPTTPNTATALIEAHSRSTELRRELVSPCHFPPPKLDPANNPRQHALEHPLIFHATATELEISISDPDIIDQLRELVKRGIMEGKIDGKKVNVGGLSVDCLMGLAGK
jgi:hypothetical protein